MGKPQTQFPMVAAETEADEELGKGPTVAPVAAAFPGLNAPIPDQALAKYWPNPFPPGATEFERLIAVESDPMSFRLEQLLHHRDESS